MIIAQQTQREAINLSHDADFTPEARAHGVNISQVAETRAEQWRRDNADAVESSNGWVENNRLPLERYCQFDDRFDLFPNPDR